MHTDRLRVIFAILMSVVLVSCADTKNRVASRIPDAPPPTVEDTPPPPPPPPVTELARVHLQAGDYQKAIDVYHAGHQRAPHDQALQSAY